MSQALPTDIYSVAHIRELESIAIKEMDSSETALMQCAGAASFNVLLKFWPGAQSLSVVCGAGNNGGDGYVLAHLAFAHGLDVMIWQVGDPGKLSGAALKAAQACYQADIPMADFNSFDAGNADVIIDAVLGIGAKGAIRDDALKAIVAINSSGLPVLSLDVPTGLDADTGAILGDEAVFADVTVTFIGVKQGLLTHNGMDFCGHLVCDRLQIPLMIFDRVLPEIERISFDQYRSLFWPRMYNTHKGDFGYVLVIGGAPGYAGAVSIAAEAAARTGAGLVTVAYHEQTANILTARRPEIMAFDISRDMAKLDELIDQAGVIVIGPGLGQSDWSYEVLSKTLASNKPKVLDADALNIIAEQNLSLENQDAIITPHPGEAARLLNITTQAVQEDRFSAVRNLYEKYQVITVLKGAGTLIIDDSALAHLCSDGNPGMACAGMGDLLAGIMGGLIAQGMSTQDAAKIGVALHAKAGDLTAKAQGQRGMMALDLIPALRELINPMLDMDQASS